MLPSATLGSRAQGRHADTYAALQHYLDANVAAIRAANNLRALLAVRCVQALQVVCNTGLTAQIELLADCEGDSL